MFNQPFPLSISMIGGLAVVLIGSAATSPRPSRHTLTVDFSFPPLSLPRDHPPDPAGGALVVVGAEMGLRKRHKGLEEGSFDLSANAPGLLENTFRAEGKCGDQRLSCSLVLSH